MSADAMSQVWYQCDNLTPAQTVVLCAVADVVNDAHGNEFWMSSTTLAAKVCMNAGNVRHRLLELVETGWIEVLGKQERGVVRYRWLGRVESTRVLSTRVVSTRVETTQAPRREDAATRVESTRPLLSINRTTNSTELNVAADAQRLADLLACLIRANDPKAKIPKSLDGWAKDIDRLIRLDDRSPAEVEKVIRWCQADHFWKSNILSGSKLRKQFTQLAIKSSSPANGFTRRESNTRESFTAAAMEFLGEPS